MVLQLLPMLDTCLAFPVPPSNSSGTPISRGALPTPVKKAAEPSVDDSQTRTQARPADDPQQVDHDRGLALPSDKARSSSARVDSASPPVSYRGRPSMEQFSSAHTSPDLQNGYSSASSAVSEPSTAPSEPTLAPLQVCGLDGGLDDKLETVISDDPRNFDLVTAPPGMAKGIYQLETRSQQLFSSAHLNQIFNDPKLLLRFTAFLHSHRPKSVCVLTHYLDTVKAIRAVRYANAVTGALTKLDGHAFPNQPLELTTNPALERRAKETFKTLVEQDLPEFITYTWIQVVGESMQRRVTGTLAPHLRDMSEGLAEVFCLSDPSRPDNPIIFASEEFQRTTQYGLNYCIGRNCRFLQGPYTNPLSVRRLAEACKNGQEHSEVLLNYRRDGQPFMNLLMMAPLHDTRGKIRYYLGAQVDVSGLVKDCTDLQGFRRQVARENDAEVAGGQEAVLDHKDELQSLSEMFSHHELEVVRRHGGSMHRELIDDDDDDDIRASRHYQHRPRLRLSDFPTEEALEDQQAPEASAGSGSGSGSSSKEAAAAAAAASSIRAGIRSGGRLSSVYQHWLLVRPAPSMRILFTSSSLRIPGVLQSPFLDRIGGSARIRNELRQAFVEGRGVTAKVRWLTRPRLDEDDTASALSPTSSSSPPEGRSRWIHATPLLGYKGEIGVWMVLLVDPSPPSGYGHTSSITSVSSNGHRKFRDPPAVANSSAIIKSSLSSPDFGRTGSVLGSSTTAATDRSAKSTPIKIDGVLSRANTIATSWTGASPFPGPASAFAPATSAATAAAAAAAAPNVPRMLPTRTILQPSQQQQQSPVPRIKPVGVTFLDATSRSRPASLHSDSRTSSGINSLSEGGGSR